VHRIIAVLYIDARNCEERYGVRLCLRGTQWDTYAYAYTRTMYHIQQGNKRRVVDYVLTILFMLWTVPVTCSPCRKGICRIAALSIAEHVISHKATRV
jgi:hypothetical protein